MEEEIGSCNVPINSKRLTNQICITWLPTVYGTNVAPLASVKTIIALDVRIDINLPVLELTSILAIINLLVLESTSILAIINLLVLEWTSILAIINLLVLESTSILAIINLLVY